MAPRSHGDVGSQIIEKMQSATNPDQMSALLQILVDITSDVKPEEVQTLASGSTLTFLSLV
jgi:hypothetical protein